MINRLIASVNNHNYQIKRFGEIAINYYFTFNDSPNQAS